MYVLVCLCKCAVLSRGKRLVLGNLLKLLIKPEVVKVHFGSIYILF